MNRPARSKLKVSRETLRQLTTHELERIAGGDTEAAACTTLLRPLGATGMESCATRAGS